ncbi:UNVERIFIED_CONTAM: Chloride intracellular channel protein 2 [Gekko kuhli]
MRQPVTRGQSWGGARAEWGRAGGLRYSTRLGGRGRSPHTGAPSPRTRMPPCMLVRYPQLAPKYKDSLHVGADIFAKFSAYIKNPHKDANKNLETALLREFQRLDDYLNTPLPEEIDQDSTEEVAVSRRKFLDGDWMTLADCNLLPKLNIIKIAAKTYRNFEIPREMTAVWRYLQNAYARDEFSHTCPADEEIERTYASVAKKMS